VHPAIDVPDPTEKLFSQIHQFVASHGAKLIVGLQAQDDKLIERLQAENIPFVSFDGAESYPDPSGAHWTPAGQKLVADRLFDLLSRNGLVGVNKASR
jgi:hypothetical protein